MPEPSENGGGLGGPLSDRTIAGIHRQAIKQRWPMTTEQRAAVIADQIKIAVDPKISASVRTKAANSVIHAEGQNQADELKATPGLSIHAHTVTGIDGLRTALAEAVSGEVQRRGISYEDSWSNGHPPADNSES